MKTKIVYAFLYRLSEKLMEIKERIIEGAATSFMTYGIRSVTMDSLASQLGISKRTIYEIFKDKDELVIEVLERMARQQRDLVKKVLDESENSIVAIFRMLEINRDNFQYMSPAFQSDLKKYHHDVAMKDTEKIEMPDYRNHYEVIEKGIEEGLFRKDVSPELVNRCLYNLGKSIMDNDQYPYEQFTRRDVIRNTFINYLRGISTPKGLSFINRLEENF
jgi:TetR/AcrR family transcriptional regulator, cholesterol catabolism regulator